MAEPAPTAEFPTPQNEPVSMSDAAAVFRARLAAQAQARGDDSDAARLEIAKELLKEPAEHDEALKRFIESDGLRLAT